jgi:hypothetical protein
MAGTCYTHGRGEKLGQNFSPKPEGKRPLRRRRRKWKDNIKIYFREIGYEVLGSIHVVKYRVT